MKNYYKAAAGFLAAAIVAFLGAQDGGVTQQEWLTIILAGLGGSGLVYIAPKNIPKAKGQGGNVDVGLLLLVAILVFVLLLFFRVHA
jgi:hypothetical protein